VAARGDPEPQRFIEDAGGVLLITARERRRVAYRPLISHEVVKPTAREQRLLWEEGLGPAAARLNAQVTRLVSHFDLDRSAIQAVCKRMEGVCMGEDYAEWGHRLWEACRVEARPHLEDLAQRIEPVATWEDLVLPAPQTHALRDIAIHVLQRAKVYETWGFAARSGRGLGISALFSGPSGTGKTMAAEVLANAMSLDLYRIDLSQVVSKYIGETEKNLRKVFDAAEQGGAILLFDEADALFGKRSEVKDSHDRYANIEVSYLLQRMETYRGLAILTTNRKGALDDAFLRRLRFVVQFPFPDRDQRSAIWRRIYPYETPTEGLDWSRLARLNVAGGNIRNIALHAAFLAAEADQPVGMDHVIEAARVEYAKLERPLTELNLGSRSI
jgi:SpoVK/Ycf46/Vps4 family AAA+-type ATPase